MRIIWLGGIVGAAVLALVIVIVASSGSGGGSGKIPTHNTAAAAKIARQLAGIPQSGATLGDPKAPVTITEWGDMVCPTCKAFALTSEGQLIANEIKTGHAKLVYRAFDTASSYANQSEFTATQTAVKAAGLQHKAWNYILLNYTLQPDAIGGVAAENVAYVTQGRLQSIASQIKGLNLAKWQADQASSALADAVTTDVQAGDAAGVGNVGTPFVLIEGPGGTQQVPGAVPALADMQALIAQVK